MADSATSIDVLGIGNALVDVLSSEPDTTVESLGLVKGSMDLIDEDRMAVIYDAMGPGTEVSGGSAANSMVGIASLGGAAHYIGRVKDDQLGNVYKHDLVSAGVGYSVSPAGDGPATGCCLILVTPDAERTMNTFLGASSLLSTSDIDADLIAASRIIYLEGYLFDRDEAQAAFRHAATLAHDAGREVALTLSDTFCVERHREPFRDLVHHHVDLLFANEDELVALYQSPFDEAVEQLRSDCDHAVVTRGSNGAIVLVEGQRVDIDVVTVDEVVDTTGAGDLFAAGYLFGYTRELSPEICGRLGATAAAEIISHLGPRPATNLAELVAPILG